MCVFVAGVGGCWELGLGMSGARAKIALSEHGRLLVRRVEQLFIYQISALGWLD